MISNDKVIFIVGPTGSGKSNLACRVAQACGGEIVCADSQTLRLGMDIGTAKPSRQQRSKVPHHMIDIIRPYDDFSVAEYVKQANECILAIKSRGSVPIVVGGSGLYVDALLFGFSFRGRADLKVRAELELKTVSELQNIIHDRSLQMPENHQNPRHLIRVIETGGVKADDRVQRDDAVVVGLDISPDVLRERILQRVRTMINEGLVSEVRNLLEVYGAPPHAWDAIGYGEIARSLLAKDDLDMNNFAMSLAKAHRKYAKRQRTWFRRNPNITWFDNPDDAYEYIVVG